MMTTEHRRFSSKSTHAPCPPTQHIFQSSIPINPSLSKSTKIKDLRQVNILNELYPFQDTKTHVQETIEIIPQPVSCERIFHSYIDDHTNLRSREYIKLDQGVYIRSDQTGHLYTNDNIDFDHRFKLDFYSTTLYIFPKQRHEKFISEIRYIPEHITIKYKTTLESLAATLSSHEHYYQNIQDFYHITKDIFYRI
ncbi:unnamed protein product [Adineta steineri]|uniref:Uncharacterized protein n=1 Tax=Adineta steineri TaxID=433720 RepID=A0A818H0G2_9BILA|nr:unnamed protein product [Adineta steineri]